MIKLLPLKSISTKAGRDAESKARAVYSTIAEAIQAAKWEIVEAPGTYGGFKPKSFGVVLTDKAASDVSKEVITMPGNIVFHPRQAHLW